jgi:hypothetical protein
VRRALGIPERVAQDDDVAGAGGQQAQRPDEQRALDVAEGGEIGLDQDRHPLEGPRLDQEDRRVVGDRRRRIVEGRERARIDPARQVGDDERHAAEAVGVADDVGRDPLGQALGREGHAPSGRALPVRLEVEVGRERERGDLGDQRVAAGLIRQLLRARTGRQRRDRGAHKQRFPHARSASWCPRARYRTHRAMSSET